MKTKILLSFCCLFTIASFSQDSVFQLKDYKYRTKGYTALSFSTSLNGDFVNGKNINTDTFKRRGFNLLPSTISYSRMTSSDKRLSSFNINFQPAFYTSTQTQNSIKNKNNYGSGSGSWNFDNQFFKKHNWFLQLGNKLSIGGSLNKQSQTPATYKNNQIEITEELFLGFGKGRIEMVQDAQMALFILNDLKEQGLITTQPDAATLNSFAQLITELNNRRIFDSRRKRIYELSQIESFLREKGITASTDIRHFTVINDNWAFSFNPFRSSGSDWFLRVVPFAETDHIKSTTENLNTKNVSKNTDRTIGIRPEVGYENFKPINLKWQRDMRYILSWSYNNHTLKNKYSLGGTVTENDFSSYSNRAMLQMNYGVSYYPNTRTRVNGSFDLLASYMPYSNPTKKDYSIRPSLGFSTDYFLGYKTRLTANLSFLYQYNHIENTIMSVDKSHLMTTYFGVSFSHFFM